MRVGPEPHGSGPTRLFEHPGRYSVVNFDEIVIILIVVVIPEVGVVVLVIRVIVLVILIGIIEDVERQLDPELSEQNVVVGEAANG